MCMRVEAWASLHACMSASPVHAPFANGVHAHTRMSVYARAVCRGHTYSCVYVCVIEGQQDALGKGHSHSTSLHPDLIPRRIRHCPRPSCISGLAIVLVKHTQGPPSCSRPGKGLFELGSLHPVIIPSQRFSGWSGAIIFSLSLTGARALFLYTDLTHGLHCNHHHSDIHNNNNNSDVSGITSTRIYW